MFDRTSELDVIFGNKLTLGEQELDEPAIEQVR
jgi:hypothetical protein